MNKMRQNIYTMFFAVVLGLSCALLLTAVAQVTRPAQEKNKEAEEIRNVLSALKVPFESGSSPADLIAIFERDVEKQELGQDDPLILYAYKPEGGNELKGVAVRFEGNGLWAPIKGFLALEPDYQTVRGLTFYEQEETPGLGGEIVSESFRGSFESKKILDAQGNWGIDIVRSGTEASGDNQVAGISAATMTCDKVEIMINEIIGTLALKRESDGR